MKWSLYLGKLSGIKVFIHWTFILLIIWIVYVGYSQGQDTRAVLWSVLFVLVIFGCITLHELGHSLAARRYKIVTRDITLLPIGGLARMERMPDDPRHELWVAAAGPLVNFVIAGILFLFLWLLGDFPDLATLDHIDGKNFLFSLMAVNLLIGLFNLIPAFPMDGGRILRALLSFSMPRVRATRIAAGTGQFLAILFVFWGLLQNPFMILIGIFIFLGAQAEAQHEQSRSLLHGHTVGEILIHHYFTLQAHQPLADAIRLLLDSQAKEFLVLEGEQVVGSLGQREMVKALSEKGPDIPVSQVMNAQLEWLSPEMSLEDVYQKMQQNPIHLAPVMKENQLVGVLDMDNISEFLLIESVSREKLAFH